MHVWILYELFGTFHIPNLKTFVNETVTRHMEVPVHNNIEYPSVA